MIKQLIDLEVGSKFHLANAAGEVYEKLPMYQVSADTAEDDSIVVINMDSNRHENANPYSNVIEVSHGNN